MARYAAGWHDAQIIAKLVFDLQLLSSIAASIRAMNLQDACVSSPANSDKVAQCGKLLVVMYALWLLTHLQALTLTA